MKPQPIIFRYVSDEHRREDNIKEFINQIPTGMNFYDLGANLGWFTLYAAAMGHSTYAFEIDENNFQGLDHNIFLNPELPVRAFNLGVADRKRTVTLRTSDQEIGHHHKTIDLEDFSASDEIISYNHTRVLEVNSLDNYVREFELPWPDYLKVDIDGSENAFLRGAPESLSRAQGMVIELLESNPFFEESQSLIQDAGFFLEKVYSIPGHPGLNNYSYRK